MSFKICARPDCGVLYIPKSGNQRYHDPACAKRFLSERAAKSYRDARDRDKGDIKCKMCGVKLSRYNPEDYCARCLNQEIADWEKDFLS